VVSGAKKRENAMEGYVNIENALVIAEDAARHGGKVVREHFGKTAHVTMKRGIEEQIPTDIESEKAILEVLEGHFPQHNIHSEELGRRNRDSPYTWVIDPLDGTSNFILGIPQVAVCVSLLRGDETQLTVIYQPMLDIVYKAGLRHGAYQDGQPVYVRQNADSLARSTVCRVLSYGMKRDKLARRVMDKLCGNTRRLLDTWAPSLDWCMLVAGKADGLVYVSSHQLRLDPGMVAGLFLFLEAGGVLSDLRGGDINDVTTVESVIAATSNPLLLDICKAIDIEYGKY
jgi:myo-inositol-1(or 4)-monophosphatase